MRKFFRRTSSRGSRRKKSVRKILSGSPSGRQSSAANSIHRLTDCLKPLTERANPKSNLNSFFPQNFSNYEIIKRIELLARGSNTVHTEISPAFVSNFYAVEYVAKLVLQSILLWPLK